MADAEPRTSGAGAGPQAPQQTGFYELRAVLTHKGRSADSGHYVSWVKQQDGSWMQFDDEKPIPSTEDNILRLSGGGDFHMAYMLLYRVREGRSSATAAVLSGERLRRNSRRVRRSFALAEFASLRQHTISLQAVLA